MRNTNAILLGGFLAFAAAGADADAQVPRDSNRSPAAPTLGQAGNGAPLEPGDAIRLTFWREPDFNGEYVVDVAGEVVLPILGPRQVIGLRPAHLKRQLQADYGAQLRNQAVQIVLLRRVRVLGAVNDPGLYYVDPTMTVADALALAGGATDEGKKFEVKVMREGEEIVSELDENERLSPLVTSGDQLVVPERSWFSRNSALVAGGVVSVLGIVLSQAVF